MTNFIGLIEAKESFPVATVAIVVAGGLVLFVAFKVGRFVLRLVVGLVALALLGGAWWWFFLRH